MVSCKRDIQTDHDSSGVRYCGFIPLGAQIFSVFPLGKLCYFGCFFSFILLLLFLPPSLVPNCLALSPPHPLEGHLCIVPPVSCNRFPLGKAGLKSPSYRVTSLPRASLYTLSLEMHSSLARYVLSFSAMEITVFHNSQCFPGGLQPFYQDRLIIIILVRFYSDSLKSRASFSQPRKNSLI